MPASYVGFGVGGKGSGSLAGSAGTGTGVRSGLALGVVGESGCWTDGHGVETVVVTVVVVGLPVPAAGGPLGGRRMYQRELRKGLGKTKGE